LPTDLSGWQSPLQLIILDRFAINNPQHCAEKVPPEDVFIQASSGGDGAIEYNADRLVNDTLKLVAIGATNHHSISMCLV
jgi:hypothetical protein